MEMTIFPFRWLKSALSSHLEFRDSGRISIDSDSFRMSKRIPVVPEPVVQPPYVLAPVVGVPAALEVALADDDRTIVSVAREAELLERDDFGGPKRVRTGGQYSAIEGGLAAWGPLGLGRGSYSITSGSSQSGSTPRFCYGCGDPGHLIR
ncbi:hypothetical protein H5410_015518 [Solanum commersonii]|uniref:Uncharacterized protein n=1 Tax=Solanum commersonii TaxID=4109 RepID=A0A9J5ZTX0_SOLCO|nr:hypothetical protein H5410_015518 [Solanum commersonii]